MIQGAGDIDLLLEQPIRFIPRGGSDAEWPPVGDWTDQDWEQWLREHNKYSYLKHWTDEEISQYLISDRYTYGIGLGKRPGQVDWSRL